jgi:hypothetical protein
MLRLPEFIDSRNMKVADCPPYAPTAFTPGVTPHINFCWRLSRPQGLIAAGRNKSMRNRNDLIGYRSHGRQAQCLNQLCQRVPPDQSNNCRLLPRITNPIITQGYNCIFFHVNVRPSSAFNPVIVSIPVSKCLYRRMVSMYGILVIHTLFLLCFLHALLLCLHAMHAHG